MPQKIIETVALSKTFYDFWGRPKVKAIDRLTFHVNEGEIFGLLGPNGSGKSTTIKILLGLLFPTSGRAAVFGGSPRSVRNKYRIGFLPEDSYLYPYQNAEEALTFYGNLFNIPHKTCQRRVDDLLEMVGLTRVRKRPLKEYSKGMARRIGIAQALINDPDLIILDEPTSGLDPIGTREIKDIILDLKKHGKTILLCSHLLADVEDLCERVSILYGGKQACEGEIRTLLSDQSVTQITTDKLPEEKLSELQSWLSEHEVAVHSIGTPSEKLESLFLRVIEKAREQQSDNSGAEAGKRIEGFFSTRSEQAPAESQEDVIAQLVQPKKQPALSATPEEQPTTETAEVASSAERETSGEKKEVIADLLKSPHEHTKQPTREQDRVATQPDKKSPNQEVLDELVRPKTKEDKENE